MDDTPKVERTAESAIQPAFDTRMADDVPLVKATVEAPAAKPLEIETKKKAVDERKTEAGPLVKEKEEAQTEAARSSETPLNKAAEEHHIFKDHEALDAYKDEVQAVDTAALAKEEKIKKSKAAVNHYLSLESEKRREHRAAMVRQMEDDADAPKDKAEKPALAAKKETKEKKADKPKAKEPAASTSTAVGLSHDEIVAVEKKAAKKSHKEESFSFAKADSKQKDKK